MKKTLITILLVAGIATLVPAATAEATAVSPVKTRSHHTWRHSTAPRTPCTVTVHKGDTVASLALKTWGRRDMIRRVAEVNGYTPNATPRPGSALMVCNFPPSVPGALPIVAPLSPKYVRVHKGDTLWRIAVREYHNGHQWKRIAQLNGISGTTIYVGQSLRVR